MSKCLHEDEKKALLLALICYKYQKSHEVSYLILEVKLILTDDEFPFEKSTIIIEISICLLGSI